MPHTTIYIIRHAETENNLQNIFSGDSALTALGREQVKQVIGELPLKKE